MASPRKQIPKPPAGNKKKGKRARKKGFSWVRLIIGAAATAIIAMICALGIYMLFIVNGSRILHANMNKLLDVAESSVVYDVNNQEVSTLKRGVNREVVDAKDIPDKVKNAFIATEDRRFRNHFGVDFYSLGRAIVTDIVERSAVEGGSTITQQLAKIVFTNSEKTVFRKATDMSIAIAMEGEFSKDEILQMYLNRIYFGNRAYGIKAAAKTYFGIDNLNDLKTWQIATLAAMPKAPNVYNPINNPQKSFERRGVVLQLMADQGYITEAERASAAAVEYPPRPAVGNQDYPAFIDTVVKEAYDVYGISEDELLSNGYQIYTTMDPKAQQVAEQTYTQDKWFQKDASDGKKIQSSMAIVNNKDGGIVAIVGARGYKSKDLNLATGNPRQPGSSFKPIASYGPALESGKYTPYSILDDEEQSFNGYTPHDLETPQGKVSMLDAVKESINVPAVWLLSQIGGPAKGMDFAAKLGIQLPAEDRNLAIALGGLSKGVTPLQMATAYSAFANGGYWFTPHTIVKIVDDKGQEIATAKPQKHVAMSAKTAYYMTMMLQAVVQSGTGTAAKLDRPAAGKTGTTQLDLKGLERFNRDVWMVGYTPDWSAAVWEGFLVTDKSHYVTVGSAGTAAIFKEVMSKAMAGRKSLTFEKPDGVPDPQQPPQAVSDLAAAYDKAFGAVKLTWTGNGDHMQYQIYRKGSKDADFGRLMDSATQTVQDFTVQKGETYQYYVTALNTDTNAGSDKSNVATVAVPADANTPPPVGGQPGTGTSAGTGAGTDKNEHSGNDNGKPGGKPGQGNGGTGTGAGTGTGTVTGGTTGSGTGVPGGTGAGAGAGSGTNSTGAGVPGGTGTGTGTGGTGTGGSAGGAQSGAGGNTGAGTGGSGGTAGGAAGTGSGTGSASSGGAGGTGSGGTAGGATGGGSSTGIGTNIAR